MSPDPDFNVWSTLSDFFTKTVEPLFAGTTYTTRGGPGGTPTAPPGVTNPPGTGTGAFSVDFIAKIQEMAKTDPRGLGKLFTALYTAAGITLGILSLIPTENNFGGPLAARMFHDLLRPIVRNVYENPTDLALRKFFPSRPVSPRILVTGMEQGAFTEDQVIEVLTEDGITDKGIQAAVQVARVGAFNADNKDDLALLHTYQHALISEAIAIVKDGEKGIIADLQSRKKDLQGQLRTVLAAGA